MKSPLYILAVLLPLATDIALATPGVRVLDLTNVLLTVPTVVIVFMMIFVALVITSVSLLETSANFYLVYLLSSSIVHFHFNMKSPFYILAVLLPKLADVNVLR
jgi:hypothetical protein